jgi:hypothetical protein
VACTEDAATGQTLCQVAGKRWPGEECTDGSQCTTNRCDENDRCARGLLGESCRFAEDCLNNAPCVMGLCTECAPYGQACTIDADCCPSGDGTPIPCSGGACVVPF